METQDLTNVAGTTQQDRTIETVLSQPGLSLKRSFSDAEEKKNR